MKELLQYFENETNIYKNIHSKNKLCFWGLLFSPLTILLYPVLLKFLSESINKIWELLILIFLIMPSFIMFFIFNYKTKKLIKVNYDNIIVNTFFWNSQAIIDQIYSTEKNKLIKWLSEKKYYNENKIEIIKKRLSEIKNEKHINFPIFPAVIGVILFPIWDKYLDILFSDLSSVKDHNVILIYIFIIVIFILFILFCIFGIWQLIKIFWENILNSDTKNIEKLKAMLNDIEFDLEIERGNGA